MSVLSRGIGRLGATCSQIFGTSRCGKVNQVIGGIALGAMLSFGILGLMYANGHLHLPHSFGWLQTAFDKIGHQAAFASMVGVGGGIPLFILAKNGVLCYQERKAAAAAQHEPNNDRD